MPDLAALEKIIDNSVAALKAGDLSVLTDLSDQAEAAMIGNGPANTAAAARLRDKVLRNEALISAALKGVKSARQRAKDLMSAGQFTTYNAAGHKSQVGQSCQPASRRL